MTRPVPWPDFPAGMVCAFVRIRLHRGADPVPALAPPPTPVLADIGLFFASWSLLDHAMEVAIWRIEGLSPDQGKAVTQKATSGVLAERLGKNMARLSSQPKDTMAALLASLAPLLIIRNHLAHGSILWSANRQRIVIRKTTDHLPEGLLRLKQISARAVRRAAVTASDIGLKMLAATDGMGPDE